MDLSRVVISLLASAAAFVLATARIAWAESPITGMDVFTFSESFTEPFLCGGEPYAVTANGHGVVHFTFFEETEALHFHEVVHGKAISVPLDGTGPTYTANFWNSDLESIRAVKHGDVLVETDTDFFRVVARGLMGRGRWPHSMHTSP